MNSLIDALADNDDKAVKESLQRIISTTTDEPIELKDSSVIEPLFRRRTCIETSKLIAEAVAEIAKSEVNRKALTVEPAIDFLLNCLEFEIDSLMIQACRALGNICYENDDARELVNKTGVEKLVRVIKTGLTRKDDRLETVACGCMLNLLMDKEELQTVAIENDVVNVLGDVLTEQLGNSLQEDCCSHVLLVLKIITEQLINTGLPNDLNATLVDLLRISDNPEISILCLEVLHEQCKINDETKFFLAEKGVCELIYGLVEKYKDHLEDDDEETRSTLKMACDTIILILTNDKAMCFLYNNGTGTVYNNMLSWLASKDFDLLSTGVLAIGNIARNDDHCVQMVQNGIAKKLLDLLSRHNAAEKDVKVQHAILGALRNLVILPENKAQILNEGLINILFPMLDVNNPCVVFTLIGTLRIVIDGQEKAALDLAMRKELLEKLAEWYFNFDYMGVPDEASRLLVWLVKHCHSTKPYPLILRVKNCVKCLVQMITSNHAVMQNEAFFALNLLCVRCLSKNDEENFGLDVQLTEAEIGARLNFFVDKYKEKLDRETVVNFLSLSEQLVRSDVVREHLKCNDIAQSLINLTDNNKNIASLHDRIRRLSNTIDGGG